MARTSIGCGIVADRRVIASRRRDDRPALRRRSEDRLQDEWAEGFCTQPVAGLADSVTKARTPRSTTSTTACGTSAVVASRPRRRSSRRSTPRARRRRPRPRSSRARARPTSPNGAEDLDHDLARAIGNTAQVFIDAKAAGRRRTPTDSDEYQAKIEGHLRHRSTPTTSTARQGRRRPRGARRRRRARQRVQAEPACSVPARE